MSKTLPPERHLNATNSDIAFTGNYAIQGNYNGPLIWDISNPGKPTLKAAIYCPASQNDVSVYKNLLFVSAEANNGRLDCAGRWRAGHGEQGAHARHPHLRHQRHRESEARRTTCRRAAARTRTRCSKIRRTTRTSTSTSRAPRRRDRLTNSPAVRA